MLKTRYVENVSLEMCRAEVWDVCETFHQHISSRGCIRAILGGVQGAPSGKSGGSGSSCKCGVDRNLIQYFLYKKQQHSNSFRCAKQFHFSYFQVCISGKSCVVSCEYGLVHFVHQFGHQSAILVKT